MGKSTKFSHWNLTKAQATKARRMKVVAVLLLATPVWGWQDEHRVFKKWSSMKAMESCWGEDNMKTYTVQLKKAISKCHATDAPELELPVYRSPFRFINTIMRSGQQHQENLMEAVQSMARNMNYNMMNGQNFQGQKYRENMQSNNMPYDQVMNTVSMMKFMREFMENKYNGMDNIAPRNYDNNQDYSQASFRRMGNQGIRFKRQVNGNTKPHGSDATILPGFLELGDRLAEKLKETKEHAIAKIGNFTCVMKEMNVLNDQNPIDVRSMKQELEKYNMPSQWFKNHEIRNIEICYQMSEAVPQSVQDDYEYPGAPNLAKMKAFLQCCKESKRRTCMYQDMKVKVENNFGPLEQILEQTGLTEAELFPLMQELLYSSEEMEYM